MVETVVLFGGYSQFQDKAKEFIENRGQKFEVIIQEDELEINEESNCDHIIIYKENDVELQRVLNKLKNENRMEIILVGNIRSRDKMLAHDHGINNFIYIPKCIGNQLDPYIREIEKSLSQSGGLFG